MALEVLRETKPLGLKISLTTDKVLSNEDLLDDTLHSVSGLFFFTFYLCLRAASFTCKKKCGDDTEVTRSFKYLGSVVHNDGEFCSEVTRLIGIDNEIMDLLNTSVWSCESLQANKYLNL